MVKVVDKFPHTTVSLKTAKNLLICSRERKVLKSAQDINAILSSHVEAIISDDTSGSEGKK